MQNANLVDATRRWLQALEDCDFSAWPELVAEDLQIVTPYAPPGFERCHSGRAVCEGMVRQYQSLLKDLRFYDVVLHATDDPNLVMGTGRSRGSTPCGHAYANEYCWIARFRDSKLVSYTEYFNPLAVLDALQAEQAAGVAAAG